jgi:hypothetical protein
MHYAIDRCVIPDENNRPTIREVLDILEGGMHKETIKKHSSAVN